MDTTTTLPAQAGQAGRTLTLGEEAGREDRKPSVNERLKDVLNKPHEKLGIEDARDQEKDQEVENDREIDRDIDRDPGLSH